METPHGFELMLSLDYLFAAFENHDKFRVLLVAAV